MKDSRKSLRRILTISIVTVIAVTALGLTGVGVVAERLTYFDPIQTFFSDPVDTPGNVDRMPKIHPVTVDKSECSLTAGPDGSVSSCPLTVLPGDGSTSGNARAPSTRFASSRAVYLITAAELAASGYSNGQSPTSIGWNYDTAPGVGGTAPLKVYLQNTSDTTYSKGTGFNAAISGMTNVHNASTALPGAAGPFDITFSGGSNFTYTGGGLYVAYDWGAYGGTLSTTSVIACNTALTGSLAGANSNTDTLGSSSFRPETRLSSSTQNDAGVAAVYSYGELPRGRVPAQAIQAVIINNGALTQTNLAVTLNVTGSQTFTDTQIIPTLAGCGTMATVTFANFTPSPNGNDTITVSVPADDVVANNSMSKALKVTPNSYDLRTPGSTTAGGVGINGAPGTFVAKFTTNVATSITDVKIDLFAVTTATYKVAIYGDSGSGTPSTTALYTDSSDRTVTVAGVNTIVLPSPVAVGPGNFYVGVQQTGNDNLNLGFDTESPVRPGTFFFDVAVPPATWNDFSPGNDFKLNIGVNLKPRSIADFDGDGKTDVSVFRRSNGNWYLNRSTAGFAAVAWGNSIDTFLTGDYDGDGLADFGLWRPTSTENVPDFNILNSNGFTYTGFPWGLPGDIPIIGDFDGDGRLDYAVYRPSDTYWYIYYTSTQTFASFQFGSPGDVPLMMDRDGDGKSDVAVFRPSNSFWYMAKAAGTPAQNFTAAPFGQSSDIKVPADYDGDGLDDVAVWRPSNGTWYIFRSSDGGLTIQQFGLAGDVAVPGDYDGDGKADIAVYRNGAWYILGSRSGFTSVTFGASGDNPVPAAYHSQNGPPLG